MNDVINMNQPQRGTSLSVLHADLQPVPTERAIAMVGACLALVRPVGMSTREAEDWIFVATETVAHFPAQFLEAACRHARRTCAHHSKIVPCIVEEADRLMRHAASMRRFDEERLLRGRPEPAKRLAPPAITQREVDRMDDGVVQLGLACGHLIKNHDGTVSPAPPKLES